MTSPITKPLSLDQILPPEPLNKVKALQEKYGEFFFPLDDVLSKLTEDTEMTPKASNFQEKREMLKQSITKNLHLYPHHKKDPEVYKKYTQDPLAYWRDELKDYDIVLQDIKNIHCLKKQLSILRIELSKDELKAPLSSMQLTPEERQQDIEKLEEIHSAIDKSDLYNKHDSMLWDYHINHYLFYHNKFIKSLYENKELENFQGTTNDLYKAYIKQTVLADTFYTSTEISTSWYKDIYEAYIFASIMRSAIAKEIEKQMEAIEQGNEPSTFNKEMEGLSLVQDNLLIN